MRRFLFPLALPIALAAALAACSADLEEACIGGDCGQPPKPPAGEGGAGGAGGGSGGAGGGPVCDPGPATGDYPCAVYDALKAKCFTCHTNPPANGAPFPLLTYEDTRAALGNQLRWQRLGPVIDSGFMPFGSAPDLTPAEKQAILDWVAGCALPEAEGSGCDCDDPAACP